MKKTLYAIITFCPLILCCMEKVPDDYKKFHLTQNDIQIVTKDPVWVDRSEYLTLVQCKINHMNEQMNADKAIFEKDFVKDSDRTKRLYKLLGLPSELCDSIISLADLNKTMHVKEQQIVRVLQGCFYIPYQDNWPRWGIKAELFGRDPVEYADIIIGETNLKISTQPLESIITKRLGIRRSFLK